ERRGVEGHGRLRAGARRRAGSLRVEPARRGDEPGEDRPALRCASGAALRLPEDLRRRTQPVARAPGGLDMERDESARSTPGAATFLSAPLVDLDRVGPGTVVISGAPHDSTHTSRFGTRMGPRGIREGSLA